MSISRFRWTGLATGVATALLIAGSGGAVTVGGAEREPEPKWSLEADSELRSGMFTAPAVSDSSAYVGLVNRGGSGSPSHARIYALDRQTGEALWTFETESTGLRSDGNDVFSAPTVSDGVVYFGSGNPEQRRTGFLYAVDARTGEQKWRVETGATNHSAPVVNDGVVYATSMDGRLYAVDAVAGDTIWQAAATHWEIYYPPVVSDATGLVYYFDVGTHAVDPETGEQQWSFEPGGPPAVYDGTVYFESGDSLLHALDGRTGEEQWRHEYEDMAYSNPVVGEGLVYLVREPSDYRDSRPALLHALDARTGDQQWSFETGAESASAPILHEGSVYIEADNTLYAVDAGTGEEQWQLESMSVGTLLGGDDGFIAVSRSQDGTTELVALE